MQYIAKFAVPVCCAVFLGVDALPGQLLAQQPMDNKSPPISISELNERPVIGALGQPLGKIVTIEGVVADGNLTHAKGDAGATLLRIESVDGSKLKQEVVHHFTPSGFAKLEKPRVGARFKYVGYETGEFAGSPPGEFKYVGPYATTMFHFTTSFVVLKEGAAKP